MIFADLSISLDGFIAGPHVGVDNPLGDGGEQLHDWMFAGRSAADSRAWEEQRFATTGALLMGRTMLDVGVGPWGDEPVFHAPVFVVTHRDGEPIGKAGGTTYTLVADGPDAALRQALAAAREQDICVAGGATVVQHYLAAGAIDQLRLHVVPVLLGDGVRLFSTATSGTDLTLLPGVHEDAGVVHLQYRMRR